MDAFGEWLKKHRKRCGMTLRDVEEKTGISNSYLSQIEGGSRNVPQIRILKELARVYTLSLSELLFRAGHDDDFNHDEHEKIERLFEFVIRDPDFKFGTRLSGQLTTDAKKFIIELYEKATQRTLLTEEGGD